MYKTVTLERGSSGLGFSIIGGFGSPHGDLPIYIKTIFNKVRVLSPGRETQGTAWDLETECSNFQRDERHVYGPIFNDLKSTVLTVQPGCVQSVSRAVLYL